MNAQPTAPPLNTLLIALPTCAQVIVRKGREGFTPGQSFYASLFAVLKRLPHLRVLEVRMRQPTRADGAVALPGLDHLKDLVAPGLTDLRVEVRAVYLQVHPHPRCG